jgi:hypothetical protein
VRQAATASTSGGSTSTAANTQTLCRHAHVIAAAAGIPVGPSKVSKLVRRYEAQVAHNGWPFWYFIANALMLTAEQRAHLAVDPEVTRIWPHRLDPTGEDAVRNVYRQRGF